MMRNYGFKILNLLVVLSVSILIGCGTAGRYADKSDNKYPDKSGNDYRNARPLLTQNGIAAYYAHKFHGKKTASGETYDMYELTAAHVSFPFNTIIRIINLENQRNIVLRINDRKPPSGDRIIDVSLKAAEELDMIISGIARVKIEVLKWGEN